MSESRPVKVTVPRNGVTFAESVHAKNFSMEERRETFHKLLFVPAGKITIEWQRGEVQASTEGGRGSLWVVPAGTRHRIVDQEPSVILLLCLGKDFVQDKDLRALWAHLRMRAEKPLSLDSLTGEVENWWRRALLEGNRKALGQAAKQRAIALHLLVAVARLETQHEDPSRKRIHRVKRSIEEALYEHWTLQSAARAAGLSRRQFSKLFRMETGKSFVEFLTGKRLNYVENLLRSGRSTVTGAAFSAGFEDLSHFYRLFRRRTGWPPLAWLAREKSKITSRPDPG